MFLTARKLTKLRNAIENNMSSDIKLSKAQMKEIIMSGGNLGVLLSKFVGPLMNVATKVLAPLGITAAMSAIDTGIQKKYMVVEQQL